MDDLSSTRGRGPRTRLGPSGWRGAGTTGERRCFACDAKVVLGVQHEQVRAWWWVESNDPVRVRTITEGVEYRSYFIAPPTLRVIVRGLVWCSLNATFPFCDVANPTKGRVEVEGSTELTQGVGWRDQRTEVDGSK